mgnify:FL=1
MDEMTIIFPTEEEKVLAAQLSLRAWEPIYEGYRQQLGDELFSFYFGDWKEKKYHAVLSAMQKGAVAKMNGRIVGFVTWSGNAVNGEGVMGQNAVEPGMQGKGIGGKLHRFALEQLKEEGMTHVKVMTGGDDAHASARRAYEKAGFKKRLVSVQYYMEL